MIKRVPTKEPTMTDRERIRQAILAELPRLKDYMAAYIIFRTGPDGAVEIIHRSILDVMSDKLAAAVEGAHEKAAP